LHSETYDTFELTKLQFIEALYLLHTTCNAYIFPRTQWNCTNHSKFGLF